RGLVSQRRCTHTGHLSGIGGESAPHRHASLVSSTHLVIAVSRMATPPNSWPEGLRGGHGSRRPASRAWSAMWSASGASAGRTLPCALRRCGRAVWLGLSSCAWPRAVRGSWTARRHSGVWRRAAVLGGSASYRLPVVVAEERQQL